jgi:hypothetical protein
MLVSCLTYSSTLKMETCSYETSVDFQRTTRLYILEHGKFKIEKHFRIAFVKNTVIKCCNISKGSYDTDRPICLHIEL